jgi:outer membrane lipoprotein carrier protein
MKKFLTLFLAFGVIASLAAQDKNPTKNDPEAKKILDAVSKKFKTYSSPQATFSYKVENAQGKALSTKKGTVTMKGTKYKVLMDGMVIISDGKTIWNYDKASNEVTVNNVDASGNAMTPQKLLTNFYDKDFYYKYNGEKKESKKTFHEIELTPTDKNKPFHKVYLLIDKSTNTISSARFLEKSGSRYVYSITSMKPSATVSDKDFSFDKAKYPGVEVVDLR